ncbi:uncharacterized protein LOC131248814 [Magnolia sinica]|uniref:uncharacterized protein LOC131248814 n=1 Tax=Magnolia sinica TaxID=86752 RepID=UPI00265A9E32|nr:uncharacterized protein LOC131248814 [Magnolia sinica]
MAQLRPPINRALYVSSSCKPLLCLNPNPNPKWQNLQHELKIRSRFSCLFADNRRQEQARKALESALGGKKSEFEKWNKEIKKREEVGGGGNAGGGGWFGGGGRFGGSNGEHFWKEAQQASLAVIGIILVYLLIAKGNIMLAVVFNSLLFVLRRARSGFTFITSHMSGKLPQSSAVSYDSISTADETKMSLAKESVVRKWGID